MQYILNVSLLTFFAERNIADVLNQMRSVVSGFDIAGLLRLLKFSEPFLMRHHMVRGAGAKEPYVLRIGGTSRSRGRHRICSMSHQEHSAMVFVVGVGGIICELSACGSRFTLLLSTLCFVVADCSAIFAFSGVLTVQTGMEAPSSEGSSMAPVLRPKLGVVFVRCILSASSLAESASCSVTSSSSVRLCVEHVAFRGVAPWENMVFFNQQHGLKIDEGGRFLPC